MKKKEGKQQSRVAKGKTRHKKQEVVKQQEVEK
jgi:hypothetical protein